MALIIPGTIAENTSPGERMFYALLADAPDDWVIFHQLDLTALNRHRPAEIDFLVLIPDVGIIAIEVKSHSGIHFDGQHWSPEAIRKRGCPFRQATDAKHILVRHLEYQGAPLAYIPVHPVVVFTDSAFEFTAEFKFNRKNFYDSRRIAKITDSRKLYDELRAGLISSIENDSRQPLQRAVDRRTIDVLKKLCAPIQSVRLTEKETIRAREHDALNQLRSQQKIALGHIFDTRTFELLNPHVLIKGGAGTGKTWVAMEAARIMADKGHRVGLLAYNKYVGEWMADHVSKDCSRPNLVAGSITKMLVDIFDIKVPKGSGHEYWNSIFLDEVEERLTDPQLADNVVFDYLVVDEAQDILANKRLWEITSQLIKGGLKSGNYSLFGDFDFQVFGDKTIITETLALLRKDAGLAQFVLRENCRNYRPVGQIATGLAGLGNAVYDGYRRSGGSQLDIDIKYYIEPKDQAKLVKEYVDMYKKLGYQNEDIVLLSFSNDTESAAARSDLGVQVHPFWSSAGSGIRYATVNAFKGLEAKKVILTDVTMDGSDFRRNQLYTGITRSTESAIILCHDSAKKTILQYLKQSDADNNE